MLGGSQITALWTSLVAMKYHIMESIAFGQYAIFNYGPPVHYRRKTCTQTFKQVSVGFPMIGASPYIIPHFLPIGKYIYKTHGPSYLHRGDHLFFFFEQVAKLVGITSTKNLSAAAWKDPGQRPSWGSSTIHRSPSGRLTPPVFFRMGCLKVKVVARYQNKNPVVLDLKFIKFFFGGETEQPEMSSDQNPWLVRLHRVYYTTQLYRGL